MPQPSFLSHISLIALLPPPYDLGEEGYGDLVVVFHAQKWNKYAERTKLKSVPFFQWRLKKW